MMDTKRHVNYIGSDSIRTSQTINARLNLQVFHVEHLVYVTFFFNDWCSYPALDALYIHIFFLFYKSSKRSMYAQALHIILEDLL